MKSIELIALQIALEYDLDEQGLLVTRPGSSEQGWYLVYRHAGGYISYFNQCLPHALCQRLTYIGAALAFSNPAAVRRAIAAGYDTCQGGEDVFWSGAFSRRPEPDEFPDVAQEGQNFVIRVGEQEACRAFSVRSDQHSAEVYVETHPNHRRQGYGRQVVAAWAHHILNQGQVAFYSYKATNQASAALARSLGVAWYADVVGYETGRAE